MSTTTQHVTVRLSSDLVGRIAAHAAERRITRSDAIASLIEHGLNTIGDAVTQCDTVVSHDELVGRLTALEAAMDRLQAERVRNGALSLGDPIPGDEGFFYGSLCRRRHDFQGSGFTRRAKNGKCYLCMVAGKKEGKGVKAMA